MKTINFILSITLMLVASFAVSQTTSITLTPVAGGTTTAEGTNVSGQMTVQKNASFGYVTFDLTSIPQNAEIIEINFTSNLNTLNTPTMGHQAVLLEANPLNEEIVKYSDIPNAPAIIDNWTWQYGATTANFNARGISEVINRAGTFITIGYRNNPANAERFNFISWENQFYRPNMVINFRQADAGAPVAKFDADKKSIKVGETVAFTDQSDGAPTSWKWDFNVDKAPNTNTSTAQNPTFTFNTTGFYTIGLTATNGTGSNTRVRSNFIQVFDVPTANFGYEVNLLEPTNVQFKDSSVNMPTSWLWDFGDSTTSTDQNPLKIYNQLGVFNVCLIINNIAGIDTICKTVINDSTINSVYTIKNYLPLQPNPASSFVQFDQSYDQLVIYNSLGAIVESINSPIKQIDVRNWPQGIYYLNAIKDKINYQTKLIVANE